ncbi:MAG: hypothetical protein M0D53_08850 [Flavobacterium sp. JAD_PAG50586_2]|nr:MAG: hypothetical protein M0D53_08850 [Flavobacterium sp. JAD_PAG50586_2]
MNYTIFLDEKKIGVSKLEKADAPMGIVFGKISFVEESLNYEFFINYCRTNSIEVDYDSPEDKLIISQIIPKLKVFNEKEMEIKGLGSYISGVDSEGFEISIIGIPYPFYEEEFPNHVKEYNEKFGQQNETNQSLSATTTANKELCLKTNKN